MQWSPLFDPSVETRDLIRTMRRGVLNDEESVMPESLVWQVFLELRRRGDPCIHRSSCIGGCIQLSHRADIFSPRQTNTDRRVASTAKMIFSPTIGFLEDAKRYEVLHHPSLVPFIERKVAYDLFMFMACNVCIRLRYLRVSLSYRPSCFAQRVDRDCRADGYAKCGASADLDGRGITR